MFYTGLHQTWWVDTIIVCHRGTDANAYLVALICTTVNVGAASAANTQPCHFDRREKSPAGREISPFGRDDKVDSRLKPLLQN